MTRPVDEVIAEAKAIKDATPRGDRTFNRDLTIMACFARELAKVSWKPRYEKDPVVDFNAYTVPVKEDPSDPDRMPWTEAQLVCAFRVRSTRAAADAAAV